MPRLLTDRKLLACERCGWVHYGMDDDEKAGLNSVLLRYSLSEHEREARKTEFRRCLRCESPASGFRQANQADIARALGHLITPVML
jgi:hypothetical protein